jgi:hypothetical protein
MTKIQLDWSCSSKVMKERINKALDKTFPECKEKGIRSDPTGKYTGMAIFDSSDLYKVIEGLQLVVLMESERTNGEETKDNV